jgi:hypothetical protein
MLEHAATSTLFHHPLALAREDASAMLLELLFPFVSLSRMSPAPCGPSFFLLKYLPAFDLLLLAEAFPQH